MIWLIVSENEKVFICVKNESLKENLPKQKDCAHIRLSSLSP